MTPFRLNLCRPKAPKNRRQKHTTRQPIAIEELECRWCPSTVVVNIQDGSDVIPITFHKGDHVQFVMAVNSDDPGEADEDEPEYAQLSSSGGFFAQVNAFDTQSFNYVIAQDGETFNIATADGDEIGTIDVTVNAPTLSFTSQPKSTVPGHVLNPVVVQVLDEQGKPDTSFSGNVTIALNPNFRTDAMLSGTLTVPADAGVATFDDLSIDKSGSFYFLTASLDDGTKADSDFFDAKHVLKIIQRPKGAYANEPIAPPIQVEVDGPTGAVDDSFKGTVTAAIGINPSGGTLSGNLSLTAVNGVATFDNLSIDHNGINYELTFNIDDGATANSYPFNIGHTLKITSEPANAVPRSVLKPALAIEVDNPDGSIETDFSGQATVTLDTFSGSGTLSGTLQQTVHSGVASFDDLSIDKSGDYTVDVTLADGTQNGAFVRVGHLLVFTQQPGNTEVGQVIAPPVQVKIELLDGSLDTNFNGPVSIALDNNPGTGSLHGTFEVQAAAGVATFDDLSVDANGKGYTLKASTDDGDIATSTAFNVGHYLTFTHQPTDSAPGAVIKPAVTVEVDNPDGTIESDFSGQVHIAIGNFFGSAKLSGTTDVTVVHGVATFSDLSIDQSGFFWLTAALDDGTQESSDSFEVFYQLEFTQEPSDSLVNDAIAPAVEVEVDAPDGTIADNFTGMVTVAIQKGTSSATLHGSLSVAAQAGVATFDDLSVDQPGQGYSLVASLADQTSATSDSFDVAKVEATSLQLSDPSGLDYGYTVTGGDLPQDVPVSFYWATGNTLSKALSKVSGADFVIPEGTAAKTAAYQGHVGTGAFLNPPDQATTLLIVVGGTGDPYFDEATDVAAVTLPNISVTSVDWNDDPDELQKLDTTQRQRIDYDYEISAVNLPATVAGQFYWSNFSDNSPVITQANWQSFVISSASPAISLDTDIDTYSDMDPARWGTPPNAATGILFVVDPKNAQIETNKNDNFAFLKMHSAKEILGGAITAAQASSRGINATFLPGGSSGLYTLSEAETRFGVDHFNWLQMVTVPSNWQAVTLKNLDYARLIAYASAHPGSTGLITNASGTLIEYADDGTVIPQNDVGRTFLDPIVQATAGQAINSVTRAFIVTQSDGTHDAFAWLADGGTGGTRRGPDPDSYYYYFREPENREWDGIHSAVNVSANKLSFQDWPSQIPTAFTSSPSGEQFLSFSTQLVGVNYGLTTYKVLPGSGSTTPTGFTWSSDGILTGAGGVFDVNLFGSHNDSSGAPGSGGISNINLTASLPDLNPPTSSVNPLPAFSLPTFLVNWSGTPGPGVAGIAGYDIFVSDNNGPYQLFQEDTTQTSASFSGQVGHTYSFYSLAIDSNGTPEAVAGTAQATTTVLASGTISGKVFRDFNLDGRSTGEPGLPGQTIYLDLNNNGQLDAGEPTSISAANGTYSFSGLNAGSYTVRQVLLGGVLRTLPATGAYVVTIGSQAAFTNEDFGAVLTSISVPLTLPLTSAFPAQGDTNADYVEAVYRSVLQRNADQGGLAYWTNLLDANLATRLQIVQGIRNSQEHFTQEVDALYETLLARSADSPGQSYWVGQLKGGMREEQIAFSFLNSPEYIGKGDRFFIDSMYESLLGRSFDSSGEAYWLGQLGDDPQGNPAGTPKQSHAQVVTDFLYSTESLQRLVEGYYEVFLQRSADSEGLNSWVAQLQKGLPFLSIGEEFVASDEFYNKAAINK